MEEASTELPDMIIVDMDAEDGSDGFVIGETAAERPRDHVDPGRGVERRNPYPEIYERALAVGFDDVYSGELRQDELCLRLHPNHAPVHPARRTAPADGPGP